MEKPGSNVRIGSNPTIDDGVTIGYMPSRRVNNHDLVIGDNAVIRKGTIIYAGTLIGNNLETGHNVVIREENKIGNNVQIWNNSTIDYGCVLGNKIKIHVGCYVCQFTKIEDAVFLAPNVSLANDKFPLSKNLTGPVIKNGAVVGMNSTVMPGIIIGEGALIGGGSVVTKDIPDYAIAAGSPAKVIGDRRKTRN